MSAADRLTNAELVAERGYLPPAPTAEQATVKVRGCAGCGGLHGSVGAERNCLEAAVYMWRKNAAEAQAELRRVAAMYPAGVTP